MQQGAAHLIVVLASKFAVQFHRLIDAQNTYRLETDTNANIETINPLKQLQIMCNFHFMYFPLSLSSLFFIFYFPHSIFPLFFLFFNRITKVFLNTSGSTIKSSGNMWSNSIYKCMQSMLRMNLMGEETLDVLISS